MKKLAGLFTVWCVLQSGFWAPEVVAATLPETLQLLKEKLESWQVEAVWPEVLDAIEKFPQDADLLETASHIAYHLGDYPEALDLMKRAIAAGEENEVRRGFALFIEETI
ncbi:MAG: hypothetical protein Q8P24_13620, partial [Desulfobacterales bacterium]|nr:hypothetical protein [Desulfobacterales bacterium]